MDPSSGLTGDGMASHPADQLGAWLADAEAAGVAEPNAMVLSTVSPSGDPSSRTVLLKHHSRDGLVFYTNHTSAKGHHLAARLH